MRRLSSNNVFPTRRGLFSTCAPLRPWLGILALLVWTAFLPNKFVAGQAADPHRAAPDRPPHMVGSWSCASTTCHGQLDSRATRSARPFPSPRSFVLWVEHDPHARAASTLDTASFDRILQSSLPARATAAQRRAAYERCATCHDPQGIATNGSAAATQRGIGCEACHGAASPWLDTHYQVRRTNSRDAIPGMTDLRDPHTRAKVCVTCHVGDESHDVDHDLLAAGHPPLRFELNGYHDLIRIQHWDDRRAAQERHEDPTLVPFVLWEAGQAAAVDATLRQTKARAERAELDAHVFGSWPEFAEFDCQACHQRLRVADRKPSSLRWQPWYLPQRRFTQPASGPIGLSFAATPSESAHRADAALRAWQRDVIEPLHRARAEANEPSGELLDPSARTWQRMQRWLAETNGPGEASDANGDSWYSACHDLLGLRAVHAVLRQRSEQSDPALPERLEQLAASLRFGSREFEWPAYDWHNLREPAPQAPWRNLPALRGELRAIASELQEALMHSTNPSDRTTEDQR